MNFDKRHGLKKCALFRLLLRLSNMECVESCH